MGRLKSEGENMSDLKEEIVGLLKNLKVKEEKVAEESRKLRRIKKKLNELMVELRKKKRELREMSEERRKNIEEEVKRLREACEECEEELRAALKEDIIERAEEAEKQAREAEERAEEVERRAEEAEKRAEEAERKVHAASEIALEAKRRAEEAEKRAEEAEKRAQEYLRRLRYLQADIENLKKRAEREKREFADFVLGEFALKLVDIAESLEKAVQHASLRSATQTQSAAEVERREDALMRGVEMTLSRLKEVLRSEGIEEIPAERGKPFDPFRHEVVASEESDAYEEGTILEVLRKGYTFKGKVLRPALVKTAKKSKVK